ncbi:MAG TPA: DUF5683 domain-containing protein, partial [Niabella sp.]|nr:DUF5683 domain-containing protein [Niabella sp.]
AQTLDTAVARQLMAAKDTLEKPTIKNPAFEETDSAKLADPKARIPRKAAIRSAILPGWGQVYNKKAWKLPFVYAAIGGTGLYLVDNVVWYKRMQYAYVIAQAIKDGRDSIGSDAYKKVHADLRRVYFEGSYGVQPEYLRTERDYYRKYRDYAAIYFVIAWALNVVEATVDAHLSSFDISPDLAFKIQPGYSEMARTAGMSFIVRIK